MAENKQFLEQTYSKDPYVIRKTLLAKKDLKDFNKKIEAIKVKI